MATGHVEKRKGAKYYSLILDFGRKTDPATGKAKQIRTKRTLQGVTREADALAILHDEVAKANRGEYVKPTKETVGQFLERWYEKRCQPSRLSPATRLLYRRILDSFLIPTFGQTRLNALRPAEIEEAYATWRENGRGESAILQAATVLRAALNQAVKWEDLTRNPALSVDRPTVERQKAGFLDPNQAERLLEAAKGYAIYPLAFVALHTGLRRGELLGLRWEHVDLLQGAIQVEDNLLRIGGETIIKAPKTSTSRRVVPIDQATIDLLVDLKTHAPAGSEHVFCKSNGQPYNPQYISRTFHNVAKRAGFDMRLHESRHTFVASAIKGGVDLRTVQDMLGHATFAMTTDTYGHIAKELKTDAAAAIGNVYASAKSTKHPVSTKPETETEGKQGK